MPLDRTLTALLAGREPGPPARAGRRGAAAAAAARRATVRRRGVQGG
nr:hypothetical protein [Angustibacter aerolatus]